MMTTVGICDLLGSLLEYPRAGYKIRLEESLRVLALDHPSGYELLRPFYEYVREMSIEELEELYTRTFDINPVCSLEVGWQLFGEEYERGAFLVRMRNLLGDCGVRESTELPDHLTHVLAVLERLSGENARELAGQAVLPSLEKMIGGLEGKDNPFESVLKTVRRILKDRCNAQS
jgi:nitrate reductase delta subunit